MPSYKTHASVNLLLGLPFSIALLKYAVIGTPVEVGCFAAAFVYGTFFLHPDLDLARNIKLFSLKGILTLPFRPYSYLFRHRKLSHTPIIGTLTRVLWLIGFFFVLFCSLDWVFPHLKYWNHPYMWFALGGIAVADIFHFVLDRI